MRLADAFRVKKRDEHYIANCYIFALGNLRSSKSKMRESRLKLLLETLKEMARILEPPRAAGAFGGLAADGPPVQMTVVHNVNRPVRNAAVQSEGESGASQNQEASSLGPPAMEFSSAAPGQSSWPAAPAYTTPSGAMPAFITPGDATLAYREP